MLGFLSFSGTYVKAHAIIGGYGLNLRTEPPGTACHRETRDEGLLQLAAADAAAKIPWCQASPIEEPQIATRLPGRTGRHAIMSRNRYELRGERSEGISTVT